MIYFFDKFNAPKMGIIAHCASWDANLVTLGFVVLDDFLWKIDATAWGHIDHYYQ